MFYIDKYEILSCDNIDEINVSCKTPNSLIIQDQSHENIESKWPLWTKYDRSICYPTVIFLFKKKYHLIGNVYLFIYQHLVTVQG